jgi:hypothetical protein
VVVLTRSVGLMRGVRVVLALLVFLSGAFGRLVLPFFGPLSATYPTAMRCLGQSALAKD